MVLNLVKEEDEDDFNSPMSKKSLFGATSAGKRFTYSEMYGNAFNKDSGINSSIGKYVVHLQYKCDSIVYTYTSSSEYLFFVSYFFCVYLVLACVEEVNGF